MEQGNTKQQMHTQEAVTSAQPQPLRAHTGAYAGPFCGSEPTNLSWDTWLPPNSQSPHSATEGKKKMGIVPQCFNRWPLTSESRGTSGEGGTSDMIQRVIYKFSTMEILPTPQQQGIQCIVFWTNKETKFRWKGYDFLYTWDLLLTRVSSLRLQINNWKSSSNHLLLRTLPGPFATALKEPPVRQGD